MSAATLADRIRANFQAGPNGCWNWTRALDCEGYGRVYIDGRCMGAHRGSYLAFVGPIPADMTVDHTCFNPACVNPTHLQLLTRAENARNKDPRKPPLWLHYKTPKRPRRAPLTLPADTPVIDFEEAS